MFSLDRFRRVIAGLVPAPVVDRSPTTPPQPVANPRPSRRDQLGMVPSRRPATVVAAVSLSLFAMACDSLAPPDEDAGAGDTVSITAGQEGTTPAFTVPKAANAALQLLLGSGNHSTAYSVPSNCWVLTVDDYPEDLDRDGLFDSCEYTAADSLSPTLHYDSRDSSSLPERRHSFWAVAPSRDGVKAFYALGYFEDRGYMVGDVGPIFQHHGDSEFITMELVMTPDGDLDYIRTCLSAHTSDGDEVGCRDVDDLPRDVWVAERKHANYFSRSECNDGAFWSWDNCEGVNSEVDLVVHSNRNMGSSIDYLVNCVTIDDTFRTDEECLWTDDANFDGWRPGDEDEAATGYGIFTRDHFQHRYYSEKPVAAFTVECEGSDCSFDASASTDDFTIEWYEWEVIVRPWGGGPLDIQEHIARKDTVPTWSHDFDVTDQVAVWIRFVARDHFSNPSDALERTLTLNCINDCEGW